jgi:hypothetical protein
LSASDYSIAGQRTALARRVPAFADTLYLCQCTVYPVQGSAALHRSPAAFLVDTDEATAIVEQIASNGERCLQVLFFLETLTDQPDEVAESASEA